MVVGQDFEITEKKAQDESVAGLASRFLPYWPLLFILIPVCIACAWIYLQYKAPVYEARATILIKDEKKGVDGSKMAEGFNQLSDTKIVDNEIEVIDSRSLMAQVVKSLRLYVSIYEDGEWRPVSAYRTTPVNIEVDNPQALHEAKRVDFYYNNKDSGIFIDNTPVSVNEWVQTAYGKLRFIPNPVYDSAANGFDSSAVRHFFFTLQNPKRVTKKLTGILEASPANKQASVIDLRIVDEDPARAEDILNNLIHTYDKMALKDKNVLADSTMTFLEERLKNVSKDLLAIEKKMQRYKSARDAIDIGSQGQLFLQNVSENDQKVSEVNMQLAVLDQIEKYVSSKNNDAEIVPSSLLVSDPVLNERLEKLHQAELEYEKLRKNTAENNPLIVSVTNQIEKLRPGILENIRNQKTSLEAGKNNLTATNEKYNKILQAVPQKEKDLIEISREQTLKTNLYNYLAQKKEETALSNSSIISDSRIVDNAEAGLDPVSPNAMIAYAGAGGIAMIIFVGLIMIRELLNKTVLYRYDIESLTSAPVIAEIPYGKKKIPLVIAEGETSFVAEQFRKLRTSLAYLGINNRRKTILVTSVIPGEGKSFIAANLGLSLALAGKKVIILEFDLVNPVLGDKFGLEVRHGVASYLFGTTEPEEIIKRTEACENLFIIPAGTLPPNPSELIMSNRTESLLNYAANIFDYVIVDTAPVGLRSDAYVLSKYCDGTLYVIRHKKTPKKSVKRIDENNKINELKNMAIVFNGVTPKGFSRNNYGYGYDYKYKDNKKKKKGHYAGLG